ncbi:hypothetical protein H8959_019119 [Pygathrix nigripes]
MSIVRQPRVRTTRRTGAVAAQSGCGVAECSDWEMHGDVSLQIHCEGLWQAPQGLHKGIRWVVRKCFVLSTHQRRPWASSQPHLGPLVPAVLWGPAL